ncbi:cytochrome b/b6 domain-containing protein [Algihabitans albus]|uniref:cytochrome b/b6 domain-containing protein n=1 Tax=Algihabitans albus TaxID=2164067 RepID=UPI000E5C8D45|nr:cytochrome b/b6 domain-containing protein [Algihabitans albus]
MPRNRTDEVLPAGRRPVGRRVWDLPTRVFHWALVVLVLTSYLTGEFWRGVDMQWHKLSGYAILALVLFRLAWGFVGTRHARFQDFLRPPGQTLSYLGGLISGRNSSYAGHNPLGGLSVLLLLLLLLVQAGSGLFASDDIFIEGPLAGLVPGVTVDWMTGVHHLAFDLLVALIALHLAAVAFYEAVKGQRLIRAMVTGNKQIGEAGAEATPNVPSAGFRGLLSMVLSAAAVAALVLGLPAWTD